MLPTTARGDSWSGTARRRCDPDLDNCGYAGGRWKRDGWLLGDDARTGRWKKRKVRPGPRAPGPGQRPYHSLTTTTMHETCPHSSSSHFQTFVHLIEPVFQRCRCPELDREHTAYIPQSCSLEARQISTPESFKAAERTGEIASIPLPARGAFFFHPSRL